MPFHNDGDAEGAFDQLMLKLDAKPIPSVEGRPAVTRGVALQGVAEAMYSDTSWPALSQALADAQQGDGAGLLALYDSYYQYNGVDWGNELEAFQTITCMDTVERLTVEEDDADGAAVQRGRAALRAGHDGQLLLHVLPGVDRSSCRHHGCGRRSDRRVWRHR